MYMYRVSAGTLVGHLNKYGHTCIIYSAIVASLLFVDVSCHQKGKFRARRLHLNQDAIAAIINAKLQQDLFSKGDEPSNFVVKERKTLISNYSILSQNGAREAEQTGESRDHFIYAACLTLSKRSPYVQNPHAKRQNKNYTLIMVGCSLIKQTPYSQCWMYCNTRILTSFREFFLGFTFLPRDFWKTLVNWV